MRAVPGGFQRKLRSEVSDRLLHVLHTARPVSKMVRQRDVSTERAEEAADPIAAAHSSRLV